MLTLLIKTFRKFKKKRIFEILSALIFVYFTILLIFVIVKFSNTSALSEEDTTPPRTPQGLEVKTKKGGLEVFWKENYEWDIFSYLLYVRTGDEKEDPHPILVGRTNHYFLDNLSSQVTYYISLAARDIAGNISKPTPEIGIAPDSLKTEKNYTISAWMPLIDIKEAQNSFLKNLDLFDSISPFEYRLKQDGNIEKIGEALTPTLKESLKSYSIKIIPSITNNFDQENQASNLLKDKNLIQIHINNIINEVEKENYDGIDIDYENLDSEVKDNFSKFIENLSQALHQKGKILSVTVQAKKSNQDTWSGPGALDFEKIGKFVDQFRIMTYDHSRPDTPPGAISPINWFSEVLEYTKSRVPKEKILAGIPFYGYVWCLPEENETCKNRGLTWQGVQNIITKYDPTISWNDQTQAPWFVYVDDQNNAQVVNYEDHRSLQAKLEVVKNAEILGISIWRLGFEDPKNFEILAEALSKKISAPKNVRVSPDNQMIHLSWKKENHKDLKGYRIKIRQKENQNLNQQGKIFSEEKTFDVLDKENYTISNLENGKPYYVSISPILWSDDLITESETRSDEKSKLILVTPSDLIFPGTISDLKIENVDTTTIDLSWTTPGDDYFVGQAEKFEIAVSENPILEENFAKSEKYPYTPKPQAAKTLQKWQLRGLVPGNKYYIAIKTYDEAGNASTISNVVLAETIDNIPPKVPAPPEIVEGDRALFLKWQKILKKM